jgi:hypothetical protein
MMNFFVVTAGGVVLVPALLIGAGLEVSSYAFIYTVHKEERVRLVLLMQRETILFMTDTKGIASYLADFYVLYKFASLEYVECTGI